MTVLGDLVGDFAANNVHQMPGAKGHSVLLANPVNGAEQFASGLGAIPDFGRLQAVVAIPAVVAARSIAAVAAFPIRHLLTKVSEQAYTAAIGGLCQP